MVRPTMVWMGLALWLAARAARGDASAPDAEVERRLEQAAELALVERVALLRNSTLAEAKARSAALSERVQGAARLPDPEFKYEQWGVPLDRPYALNRADTLMFGLRQAFPAPGARAARERVAGEEQEIGAQQRRMLLRDLLLRVRRTYFDYYAADRALNVHLEHIRLAEQIVAQVRSDYELGRGSQQDLLKVLLELSRVHNDVAEIRQQRESGRLLLNALMARAPDAPLGPPLDLERPNRLPGSDQLERARAAGRPELAAAQGTLRRSQAALDAAQIAARRPSFMVGADYWWMPLLEMPHAYGAMVTMSLPWLIPGRRADVREAEQLVHAERHAAAATETLTAFELRDALVRLEAASAALRQIEGAVLPQAEQSLSSSQAAFALGQTPLLALLDALRAYFQIRLEHSRALSRVMSQLALVEFASGASLLSSSSAEARP